LHYRDFSYNKPGTHEIVLKQSNESTTENIEKLGQPPLPGNKSNIYTISIIGQIEGHMVLPSQNKTTKYEHIIPQLVAVEQNPEIQGLLIILNTVGGDVEAGLAIAEMIDTLSKPSVSLVLGGGHSIGVSIAVASDVSYIAPTATMTIHPIRLSGNLVSVPQTFDYLEKMQERISTFIVKHSNIMEDRFKELMFNTGQLARDIGTVLIGDEAVREGLINEVGGVGNAVKILEEMIEERQDKDV